MANNTKTQSTKKYQNKKRGPQFKRFILNCIDSLETRFDWDFDAAAGATFVGKEEMHPESIDLREDWWSVRHQKNTGACVGFATADGILRWLYVKEEMIEKEEKVSPRFIWMANKETDEFNTYPTSFLDSAGTSTKLGLKVAKKYGCVPETMLPMKGDLSKLSPQTFFSIASQYRINAYYNLKGNKDDTLNLDTLKSWISSNGPILTRLDVDDTWANATKTNGILEQYKSNKTHGGHAVCLVGYDKEHFIVRNSWGENWGDKGFAYASYDYTKKAFTEAYGAILNRLNLIHLDEKNH